MLTNFLQKNDKLLRNVSAMGPEELGEAKGGKFRIKVKDTPPIYKPPHRRLITNHHTGGGQLNMITIAEPFPMPNPQDIFNRLAQSTLFSGAI